jgi:hypothetical protein
MIKKTDSPAKRSVEVEIDVPGTPEEVWQAIATGPGFTAWFVPARLEEHEGGAGAFEMAPGMETNGSVKVWEPGAWRDTFGGAASSGPSRTRPRRPGRATPKATWRRLRCQARPLPPGRSG